MQEMSRQWFGLKSQIVKENRNKRKKHLSLFSKKKTPPKIPVNNLRSTLSSFFLFFFFYFHTHIISIKHIYLFILPISLIGILFAEDPTQLE